MTDYRWDSIGFEDDLPTVSLVYGKNGGDRLVFGSLEELKELVNTLKGAINAEEREVTRPPTVAGRPPHTCTNEWDEQDCKGCDAEAEDE